MSTTLDDMSVCSRSKTARCRSGERMARRCRSGRLSTTDLPGLVRTPVRSSTDGKWMSST